MRRALVQAPERAPERRRALRPVLVWERAPPASLSPCKANGRCNCRAALRIRCDIPWPIVLEHFPGRLLGQAFPFGAKAEAQRHQQPERHAHDEVSFLDL